MRKNNKLILIVIICLLFGYTIGYTVGSFITISWCVDKAAYYLDFEVNDNFKRDIHRYQAKLGDEDALIRDYSGNKT